jgi:hypothetical protein
MSATLEWNRLTIAAQGDAEFKTAVDKNLGDLLKTSFPQLEIDIGQCTGLGDEAFKLIGLKLVDAAGNRRLVVRVAEDMRRYFEGSGLHELVDVYVIERMDANTRIGDDGEDDGEGEVSELAPMSEIASIEKEDTAPPSELVGVTGAQGIATGGVLVDDDDRECVRRTTSTDVTISATMVQSIRSGGAVRLGHAPSRPSASAAQISAANTANVRRR